MPAQALIVNADDLGLWPTVDRGILDAWGRGAIGDSSVFATAPDLAGVLRQAAAVGLPAGIHLNLTFGRPLSDPAEVPALVGPTGAFLQWRAWSRPLPEAQVRAELSRQVARVLAAGWRPSHLDTHHHVHRFPAVLAAVMDLARELGVPMRALDAEMRQAAAAAHIPAPDHFAMDFFGERATLETLIALVEDCPGGSLEIMTHPGWACPEIPSSYREERERELRALISPQWRAYLRARDLPEIGYGALA